MGDLTICPLLSCPGQASEKWSTALLPRVDGVNAVELTKKVRSHAAAAPATLPAAPKGTLPLVHCLVDETFDSPQEDLNTKLKRLINAHKCMLFMKVRKVLSVFKKEEKS